MAAQGQLQRRPALALVAAVLTCRRQHVVTPACDCVCELDLDLWVALFTAAICFCNARTSSEPGYLWRLAGSGDACTL